MEDVAPDSPAPDSPAPDSPAPTAPPGVRCLDTVIALYDFAPLHPLHLALDLGDTIYVLARSGPWWDGVCFRGGAWTRGWFPRNYVRLVNYVQPVLKQLHNPQDLDTLTAANTAANVLIPLFTALLQKNLGDTSASATRKNSVVSFALDADDVRLVSVEEAEQLSLEHRRTHGRPAVWLPRATDEGDIAFFCDHLRVCCASLPLVPWTPGVDTAPPILPSADAVATLEVFRMRTRDLFDDASRTAPKRGLAASLALQTLAASYHHFLQPFFAGRGVFWLHWGDVARWPELSERFDQAQAGALAALRAGDRGRYDAHFLQLTTLVAGAVQSARLSHADYAGSKYERAVHRKLRRLAEGLAQLGINAQIHVLAPSNRRQSDLQESPLEGTPESASSLKLPSLALGVRDLSLALSPRASVLPASPGADTLRGSRASGASRVSGASAAARGPTLLKPVDATVILPAAQSRAQTPDTAPPESYLRQAEIEAENLRTTMHGLVRLFRHLSRNKRVFVRDYDSSDLSEDDGEDRTDLLPQVYPRFVTNEFNGGNWCNPFFVDSHPYLNLSGDLLKNRYHLKTIVDQAAYDEAKKISAELVRFSRDVLHYLDPALQFRYYNEALKNERNDNIVRIMYKFMHCASTLIDHLESFDFTVFCLIKRNFSGSSADDPLSSLAAPRSTLQSLVPSLTPTDSSLTLADPPSTPTDTAMSTEPSTDQLLSPGIAIGARNMSKENSKETSIDSSLPANVASNLTFDYPMVLEFFQRKQQLHDMLARIMMQSQTLTLEDPDVFTPMKESSPVLYDRDALKDPIERSAFLLAGILADQSLHNAEDRIYINQDKVLSKMLEELIDFCDDVLVLIRQLIDERETILNYATRVMHDDFNIELLVIERNNTVTSTKTEDVEYFSGKSSNDNTPWYLQGDEEYDLLIDVNGNIKGGTKEALVAHLTHHSSFDATFNTTFLISFATMMTVNELIHLLMNRFNIEAPEGLSYEEYLTWRSRKRDKIRFKVLDVMRLLLENHWCGSYTNKSLLTRWIKFLRLNEPQQFDITLTIIEDIKFILDGGVFNTEKVPTIITEKAPAPLLKSFSLRKLKLMDIEYVELARQLTLREFGLYCSISKLSAIHKVWGKKSGLNESVENITNFIKASNQLTNFVAYMILRKDDAKKRVQIIRFFVQVAEKCRSYNNFSSMTAIISALYSSPIHRLKKTWSYVSRDTMTLLQNMNKLMNSSRNFNEYRDMLKFIGLEPCVPFFGVYLSDLTFVLHGNPDNLLNRTRMINFAKRTKTVDIVLDIDRFKRIGYNFQEVSEIQNYLDLWFDKCPTIEEQYQLSLNIEPREQGDKKQSTKPQPNKRSAPGRGPSPKYQQSVNVLGIR